MVKNKKSLNILTTGKEGWFYITVQDTDGVHYESVEVEVTKDQVIFSKYGQNLGTYSLNEGKLNPIQLISNELEEYSQLLEAKHILEKEGEIYLKDLGTK